ncbi:regulation of nuclear pre-mRNA domain-containing protein 2 isoform X2 [Agrilus planipennis]|uniref:Regulation of nuclear pre-mRNA domain-containing protein 2 n=1 Tax=Agrilus planipennis TaxID=224129 RepID=A0A1W4XJ24_AGRPL|nr:regulation of nuclear pre-mRNA domain-containing protein 2 isoform X2 [Agrilus planipennis]
MTSEFNTAQFEKRLSSLKDSQESINSCCHWCLENRQFHKKIVLSWFNVLKRAKVEQRLTLFYLANDVIQYSKRKNYDFVESWVTTLQKATTMVRDEKVKHKILRIFKIWEQRGVYGEEFISDLCGLISASPKKTDEPTEFQLSYLMQKIKNCSNLETETDLKLKQLKEHNPKIQIDAESLVTSLKDRAHVDDVEKELDDYTKHIESYVAALKTEIKARSHLISVLQQAQTQLETERKDVKVVANAYKTFGTRVKSVKKKIDEVLPTLPSPIPSPDVNAPSPSPDSDIELPSAEATLHLEPQVALTNTTIYTNAGYYNPTPLTNNEDGTNIQNNNFSSFMGASNPFNLQDFNTASLFNKSQDSSTTQSTNLPNQKSIGDDFTTKSVYPDMSNPPPKPVAPPNTNYQYNTSTTQIPSLPPPPMPPFSKHNESYGNSSVFDGTAYNSTSAYSNSDMGYQLSTASSHSTPTPTYEQVLPHFEKQQFSQSANTYHHSTVNSNYNSTYDIHNTANYNLPVTTTYNHQSFINSNSKDFQNSKSPFEIQENSVFVNPSNISTYDCSIPPTNIPVTHVPSYSQNDEYNPEEEPETWDSELNWEQVPPNELDTPESPPLYEKEGYNDPVEYHDGQSVRREDVDHRILPVLSAESFSTKDMKLGHRGKDVDHRNLISLTGSPGDSSNSQTLDTTLWSKQDQDYRNKIADPFSSLAATGDQDYRTPFNFENLNLPPPPPPPAKNISTSTVNNLNKKSPKKCQDNIESIDMDLSDDENLVANSEAVQKGNDSSNQSVNSLKDNNLGDDSLQPPPPFPDLTDDIDANNFLDSLNDEINCGEFESEKTLEENSEISMNNLNSSTPFGVAPFEQGRWNASMVSPANFPSMQESMNLLPIPANGWTGQDFSAEISTNFRGRGGRLKNNFGNRGARGNWLSNNYRSNENNQCDFKGGGNGDYRGRIKTWVPNGHNFRGGRGTPRSNRGFNRGGRARANFKGNFRGNF